MPTPTAIIPAGVAPAPELASPKLWAKAAPATMPTTKTAASPSPSPVSYTHLKGHLEIASSSVPGAYILPGLMKGFLEKHGEVTFAVMLRDTRRG